MKKIGFLTIVGLTLTLLNACGTPPGQITGNNRVSIGVAVNDVDSAEIATKTVTAATATTPQKVSWAITTGKGVTFTFMTRPGSDAVYITGYRVVSEKISTVSGTTTTSYGPFNKMDLYLTSGYDCSERTALRSCAINDANVVTTNGLPGQHVIYLEGGLGDLVKSTDSSVSQVTNLEFIGTSSSGAPVSVVVDGVVSRGIRNGDL